jgi:hypothetical protein
MRTLAPPQASVEQQAAAHARRSAEGALCTVCGVCL